MKKKPKPEEYIPKPVTISASCVLSDGKTHRIVTVLKDIALCILEMHRVHLVDWSLRLVRSRKLNEADEIAMARALIEEVLKQEKIFRTRCKKGTA